MGITRLRVGRMPLQQLGKGGIGLADTPLLTKAAGELVNQPGFIWRQLDCPLQRWTCRCPILPLYGCIGFAAQLLQFQAAAQAGEHCLLPRWQAVKVGTRLVG